MNEDYKNILIISEGQLGDLLLLTPTIKALKKKFPNVGLDLLIIARNSNNLPEKSIALNERVIIHNNDFVLSGNNNINNIYVVPHFVLKNLPLLKKIKSEFDIVRFIRKKKYDVVLNAFPHDRFIIWSFLSGAKIRVGERKNILSVLLTDKLEINKENEGVLIYYTKLLQPFNINVTEFSTEFFINEKTENWLNRLIKKYKINSGEKIVTIHPGASGNYKIWPPEKFGALIKKLELQNVQVILCGGESDKLIINEIKKYNSINPFVIFLDYDLNKLAALFKLSSLCITNDSGPRHLAVAVGTKSLAIFRKYHTNAWKIYPEGEKISIVVSDKKCSVCPVNECKDLIPENTMFGSYCISEISVDTVFEKAMKMINFR